MVAPKKYPTFIAPKILNEITNEQKFRPIPSQIETIIGI